MTTAKKLLIPSLSTPAWTPLCWRFTEYLAFTHVPNFWAILWKCVLCDCALDTSGRGVIVDFPWGVWHFTIKICKNHITPFLLVSGHGSLVVAFPLWLHAFSFQPSHCIAVVSIHTTRRTFWLGNVQHRNSPTYKRAQLRVWKFSRNQWMNVGKMLK